MLTYTPTLKPIPELDAMFQEAVELVRTTGLASASYFQRHLKVGYARAASILDELEQHGIIGPVSGAKPREILIPHTTRDGENVIPVSKPKPELVEEEINPVKWNKAKFVDRKSKFFDIEIGTDENNKLVKLDLEKYGNLLVVGSQFTSAVDFLNNVLAISMATYSPDELRTIVVDGIGNDLIVPNQSPHLLTQVIIDPLKVVSAMMWTVSEIERRLKIENISKLPKILLLINSLNSVSIYSSDEFNSCMYRIMAQGRKMGVFAVIGTDYPNPRSAKEIIANSPAKLVFKPTDKKIARDTGVVESFDLKSPDEAILNTMYEGKTTVTINKVNPKEIYDEIYS